jgi:hypothetical protein
VQIREATEARHALPSLWPGRDAGDWRGMNNEAYQYYLVNAPEVYNPRLDRSLPHVEQLIHCPCKKMYRVFVNGTNPISDMIMLDVVCPHCGAPAAEFASLSGHSADVFNTSLLRGIR